MATGYPGNPGGGGWEEEAVGGKGNRAEVEVEARAEEEARSKKEVA